MSENFVFGFSSRKTFLYRGYLNDILYKITFFLLHKINIICLSNREMIEITFFMNVDKNLKKTFGLKKF